MLRLDGERRWMIAAVLLCGIFDKNSACESSDTETTCRHHNALFVTVIKVHATKFPTEAIYSGINGTKLCFNVQNNSAGCCQGGDFDCNFTISGTDTQPISLILNEEILSKHDVVLMVSPDQIPTCKPLDLTHSIYYSSGFFYSIHKCLNTDVQNVRLSRESLCKNTSHCDREACKGLAETDYKFTYNKHRQTLRCVSCNNTYNATGNCPTTTTTTDTTTDTTTTDTTTTYTTTTTTDTTTDTTTTTTTTTDTTTTDTTTTDTTTTDTTTTDTTTTDTTTTTTDTTTDTTTPATTGCTNGNGTSSELTIVLPPPGSNNGTGISPEIAADVMNNMSCVLDLMDGYSKANIIMGDIKGKISKLPSENQTLINFDLTTSGDVNNENYSVKVFSRLVRIPTEAVAMAVKKNSSFVAALLFPGMHPDDSNSFFLNNEAMGIEMGTEIANLSHTIDIHYGNVEKNGSIFSCRSWDGEGEEATWIPDGCETNQTADGITCRCSHLTFFAILMSPPPGNISSSDFQALTYITSIGCGLSVFFLMVGLFMYCLIRKEKANQATRILMNLFVAMLTLNLSFVVNDSIAQLEVFGACVAVAAVMHYTMLATISWFFMQALHLYLNLRRLPTDIKHYMMKICVAGWVTPAVVVIVLAALSQYDYLVINFDDGDSTKMCFISNAAVHQGVNIGYYGIVFIFTFAVFIVTVRQIVLLKPAAGKADDNSHLKTKSFSIFCLFLLLGITWAFAFFRQGPLLIPSYYIFTILNTLQGFFLFLYYYNSRKVAAEDTTVSGSSTATLTSSSDPVK